MNDETKHRARSKYSCEHPMVFMLKYSRSRFITGVFSLQRFRSFFSARTAGDCLSDNKLCLSAGEHKRGYFQPESSFGRMRRIRAVYKK